MFKNLSAGAVGIRASLSETLELARINGFDGVDFSIAEVAELVKAASMDDVKALFARTGVRPGCWGFPLDFRGEEQTWRESLDWLRVYASHAQELGCHRTATWISPVSNERTFQENFDFHVQRLKPAAEILHDYGCVLGLEFIGPKTIRNGAKHEFVYTMHGMLDLCAAIGPNAGLLVDLWHVYTAHDTNEAVGRLRNEQVVTVHVNDAPPGIPVDEQLDQVRCLPGETGVLDTTGFLHALKHIGYDGPVTAEPFNKRVNALPASDAARETGDALTKVWRAAGLA